MVFKNHCSHTAKPADLAIPSPQKTTTSHFFSSYFFCAQQHLHLQLQKKARVTSTYDCGGIFVTIRDMRLGVQFLTLKEI